MNLENKCIGDLIEMRKSKSQTIKQLSEDKKDTAALIKKCGQDIKDINAKIKELKEQESKKRWRAESTKVYFYIDLFGYINSAIDCRNEADNYLYNSGNYFRSRQETEEYKKKLLYQQQYKDYVNEHSDKLDWRDNTQNKFYVYYDFVTGTIKYDSNCRTKKPVVYVSNIKIINNFINLIGKDNFKKYILEVEE